MRTRTLSLTLLAAGSAALVACGGGGGNGHTDAHLLGDGSANGDAPVPEPDAAAKPAGCDYGEQMDPDNNDWDGTGAAEDTGLTITSTGSKIVCGDVNVADAEDDGFGGSLVDGDGYNVEIATAGNYLIEFNGSGGSAIDYWAVVVYDSDGDEINEADYYNDHGVASVQLTADTYELDVYADSQSVPAANIHYKIRVSPDAHPCTVLTGSANYVETNDTGSNNGNDVFDIPVDGSGDFLPPTLTAQATDKPDNFAAPPTIASGSNYLITGTMGSNATYASSAYLDRDSYLLTSGSTTNEMNILVNYNGGSAGSAALDWYLFDGSGSDANIIASPTFTEEIEDPDAIYASVKPSTQYLLWIGLETGSMPTTMSYSVSVCGGTYTPF
jgi:hypothetical protein